ncbi:MAG: T9SS C-terminal target domain-containing protein [Sphingobacteriales bacterium]|nr:MAG: T9SS C-terminal target domain-containing protein [Sphingobacteriales bacterium]
MFKSFGTLLAGILCLSAQAQTGCTDPASKNYNVAAKLNDGSCKYDSTHYQPQRVAELPSTISETSGLIWDDGNLWTMNDSDSPAEFYKIDSADGRIIQTVHVDKYPNVDWEEMTADADYLYIGDFGNNAGRRRDQKILKIAKKDIGTGSDVHVKAEAISISYSDQTDLEPEAYKHNFDCEAMISIGDSLYLFTKNWGDFGTKVYKLAKTPGKYRISPYDSFSVNGLITGAAYNKGTKEIILLGYTNWSKYSMMWFLNGYTGDHFFSGNKQRVDMGNGQSWQTEAVCFMPGGGFYISNETAGPNSAAIYTSHGAILLHHSKR